MPIALKKLYQTLRDNGIPVQGMAGVGDPIGEQFDMVYADVRIDFAPEATPEQRNLAATLKATHDPTDTDQLAIDDIHERWQGSAIHGKTPAQIYTTLQGQIDGWTSLAQAKTDLRAWLPLLTATLAWVVMKDDQR